SDLDSIHQCMRHAVEQAGGRIAAIYHCPHTPEAGCDCRKPKPGLFLRFAQDFGVPLDEIPAIGDSLRDLEAALHSGARPVLVLTGHGQETRAALARSTLEGIEIQPDLAAFAASLGI
ncbi:histidinol-phosphate phosphatase family protein, partial [mine drainage metagenome]